MVILKKLFNSLFSEKAKEIIRIRFSVMLEFFDKIIIYKEYLKACKYVLKKKIFMYKKRDYGYRHDIFLENIKQELIRNKIIYEKFPLRDEEMRQCVEYVKEKGTNIYCGSLDGVEVYSIDDIAYDEKNKLYYGKYEGKKLYFNSEVNTKEKALAALNGLAAEQTDNSPHKYLDGDFQVKDGDIVFDVGCADGNFSLSVIEKAGKVYLFEADECWMKPLQLTFEPYMDKVTIIKKYVTENNNDDQVSLDVFCKDNGIDHIDMVKMDVEGYESNVLCGAKRLLGNKKINKIAICTYHKLMDEKNLGDILHDFKKVPAKGYMLGAMIYDIYDIKPPYFTKGLLRATLK